MSSPFRIICKNCGAAAGYDIIRQTYRCPYCGELSGVQEVVTDALNWRKLHKENRKSAKYGSMLCECTACGAEMLFDESEASEKCEFCGGNLVRKEFKDDDNIPDLIIPFVLTAQDASCRLRAWAQAHKNTKEGKLILSATSEPMGWYLPYRLVRGPVAGKAERDQAGREYTYHGFLELTAVNTSSQLDNLVLNEIEPFDWTGLVPFEYGYIGGHKVKLNDMSQVRIQLRVLDEATQKYRPVVSKALHTDDVWTRVITGDFVNIPALLPVYILKLGKNKLTAVVNGQTGRVAVTSLKEPKPSRLWLIEPAILTLILTLAAGWAFVFNPYAMFVFGGIAGLLFFIGYGDGRNALLNRIILRGKASRARRDNGALVLNEEKKTSENPFSNEPVFYEKHNGTDIPVKIKFYTPTRVLTLLLKILLLIFAPLLAAAVIRTVMLLWGAAGAFFAALHPEYGAAWYALALGISVIYWIKGVRNDVFNHPFLYEILPDGGLRLIGTRQSRRVSVLALFGFGNDENVKWSGLEKRMQLAMIGIAILFIGSTAAILF